jgi:hypothetical protein
MRIIYKVFIFEEAQVNLRVSLFYQKLFLLQEFFFKILINSTNIDIIFCNL